MRLPKSVNIAPLNGGRSAVRVLLIAACSLPSSTSVLRSCCCRLFLRALALAISFAAYGVLKKRLELGPVVSVTAEVLLVAPIACIFLILRANEGAQVFGGDALTFGLLVLSGPVTALPLVLFSYGARRMRMASVGLILYLNPTLQFACAVFVFAEPFGVWQMAAFAIIWIALAIYSAAAWRQEKDRRTAVRQTSASGTAV